VRKVPLARAVQDYAVRVLQATHPETKEATAQSKKYLRYGASPRGLQAIILAAKIRALLEGRYAVAIDDIRAVAAPALRHRLILNFEGEAEGVKRRRHHRRDPGVDPRDGVSWMALLATSSPAPATAGAARAADRSGLFDERFLRTLEHLHMVSRKVFAGNLRAERRTRKVGSGIEFADHRTYARGDDFRYIDWNLYGRLDRLLLRLFEEEEDLHIYILIDCSDSMAIGNPPKMHYAMKVGAALTYVGLANLDRVAIVPFAAKPLGRLPPSRGKNRIFRVFDFLRGRRHRRPDRRRRGDEGVRQPAQAPRPGGVDQRLLRPARLRGGHQHAALQQVRAVRAAGLRSARGGAQPARRSGAGRLRDRRAARGDGVQGAARGLHPRAREVLQGARDFCTQRAVPFFRTHTGLPFDELVLRIFRSGGFLR
jgi:hypothetical protein